jgi:hypothetical protein
LGYVFGFKGDGFKAANPHYEIKTAFPELYANYGLLSGPANSIANCMSGLFMGLLVDKLNRTHLLGISALLWGGASLVTGFTESF